MELPTSVQFLPSLPLSLGPSPNSMRQAEKIIPRPWLRTMGCGFLLKIIVWPELCFSSWALKLNDPPWPHPHEARLKDPKADLRTWSNGLLPFFPRPMTPNPLLMITLELCSVKPLCVNCWGVGVFPEKAASFHCVVPGPSMHHGVCMNWYLSTRRANALWGHKSKDEPFNWKLRCPGCDCPLWPAYIGTCDLLQYPFFIHKG